MTRMTDVTIRSLAPDDIPTIVAAFAALGWKKTVAQYQRYLADQQRGERMVLVALQHAGLTNAGFAGYLTIVWQSDYPPFRDAGVPEIVDFNVLPHLRRRGIGSQLMDAAEQYIAQRSAVVGIGVGLDRAYGAAQRLYVQRGYIPDGRGLISHGHPVAAGEMVAVDDGLVICFTKTLRLSYSGSHEA